MPTLGTMVAVQAPSLIPDATQPSHTDIVSLITHAGIAVQIILAILLLFSAVSWGIIFYKKRQFSRAAAQTGKFLETFRKSSRFFF